MIKNHFDFCGDETEPCCKYNLSFKLLGIFFFEQPSKNPILSILVAAQGEEAEPCNKYNLSFKLLGIFLSSGD